MNARQHAMLARTLIEKCGGLTESASACRVSKSLLSSYQSADHGFFMPADVLSDLEAYCGEPVYSRALFEARPSAVLAADLIVEACEASEAVTALQRDIRLAAKDGAITPAERQRLQIKHAHAEEELRQVGAVISGNAKSA